MTRVYDLPTRLFHWLFAGIFIGAYFIASYFDDESVQYPYHMMLGMTLTLLVLLRVLWGLVGSKHARFSSFVLKPQQLVTYFKNILSSKTELYVGHNPASSWAAIAMMILTLGLALSGYMMVNGTNKHFFKEIHEIISTAFLIVVIGHVAGIILHTIKHKDAIGMSMIHGKKRNLGNTDSIQKNHVIIALLLAATVSSFVVHLNKNYNRNTQNLTLFGTSLQLGKAELESKVGPEEIEED